ncbi:unnamed protein product [Natator depressus]
MGRETPSPTQDTMRKVNCCTFPEGDPALAPLYQAAPDRRLSGEAKDDQAVEPTLLPGGAHSSDFCPQGCSQHTTSICVSHRPKPKPWRATMQAPRQAEQLGETAQGA